MKSEPAALGSTKHDNTQLCTQTTAKQLLASLQNQNWRQKVPPKGAAAVPSLLRAVLPALGQTRQTSRSPALCPFPSRSSHSPARNRSPTPRPAPFAEGALPNNSHMHASPWHQATQYTRAACSEIEAGREFVMAPLLTPLMIPARGQPMQALPGGLYWASLPQPVAPACLGSHRCPAVPAAAAPPASEAGCPLSKPSLPVA
jgi:hypothetical protein